jgi:hypothetical protein
MFVMEETKICLAHHVIAVLSSVTETATSDIYFFYPGVLQAIFHGYLIWDLDK